MSPVPSGPIPGALRCLVVETEVRGVAVQTDTFWVGADEDDPRYGWWYEGRRPPGRVEVNQGDPLVLVAAVAGRLAGAGRSISPRPFSAAELPERVGAQHASVTVTILGEWDGSSYAASSRVHFVVGEHGTAVVTSGMRIDGDAVEAACTAAELDARGFVTVVGVELFGAEWLGFLTPPSAG